MFDIVWYGSLSIAQLQTVIFISSPSRETFISLVFVCRFIWIHIVCCFLSFLFLELICHLFYGLKKAHSYYDHMFFCDRDDDPFITMSYFFLCVFFCYSFCVFVSTIHLHIANIEHFVILSSIWLIFFSSLLFAVSVFGILIDGRSVLGFPIQS